MIKTTFPSITQFEQVVQLKDYREPTRKEHVRYVRKLAEHFQCDPATLSEDQVRQYLLFLRQHKRYKHSPMKAAKVCLALFLSGLRQSQSVDRFQGRADCAATGPAGGSDGNAQMLKAPFYSCLPIAVP
jgi:hypothetical protein